MINYLFAGVTLVLICWTAPALASHPHACSNTVRIESDLAMKYNEAVTATGTANQYAMKVFLSETGSWTIIYTSPAGFSCVMLAGEDWEAVPWEAPGRKS